MPTAVGLTRFDYKSHRLVIYNRATQLQRNLSAWMPWNYRDTLARLATAAVCVI